MKFNTLLIGRYISCLFSCHLIKNILHNLEKYRNHPHPDVNHFTSNMVKSQGTATLRCKKLKSLLATRSILVPSLYLDDCGQPLAALMKLQVPLKLILEHKSVFADSTLVLAEALRNMYCGLRYNLKLAVIFHSGMCDLLFSIKSFSSCITIN